MNYKGGPIAITTVHTCMHMYIQYLIKSNKVQSSHGDTVPKSNNHLPIGAHILLISQPSIYSNPHNEPNELEKIIIQLSIDWPWECVCEYVFECAGCGLAKERAFVERRAGLGFVLCMQD